METGVCIADLVRRTMPVRPVASASLRLRSGQALPAVARASPPSPAVGTGRPPPQPPGRRRYNKSQERGIDDSSCGGAVNFRIALCRPLGAIAFGNEASDRSSGSFRLHRSLDGNPARAHGHLRRTPHRFSGLSALCRLDSIQVPKLWHSKREVGTVHHSGGMATWIGEWHDGVTVVAIIVHSLTGLVAVYAWRGRQGFDSADLGCIS
jgi:hypothetical protein